jgi:hypothetical protein
MPIILEWQQRRQRHEPNGTGGQEQSCHTVCFLALYLARDARPTMHEFLLCSVEDTFLITGRGLVIAPAFPVSAYRFEAHQRVRVVRPDGEQFECRAHFQIPFQSPRAKVLSFLCALLDVSKEDVPIGSEVWLLGKQEDEVKLITATGPGQTSSSCLSGPLTQDPLRDAGSSTR